MPEKDADFGTCSGCGKRMDEHDRVEMGLGRPVLFCPGVLKFYADDDDESTPD